VVAGGAVADRVVVTVEEETERRIELAVVDRELFEDHLLEEPRRVGDVPLGWRDIDGRLRDVVFDLERLAELLGRPSDAEVVFE
jgi:hypothetical protein